MDFVVPASHKVKIKESKKGEEHLDLNRKVKMLLNMRMTVILKVIGALGTASKGLEKRLEKLKIKGRIETIHTIALLTSTKIVRRLLVPREELLSLNKGKGVSSWCNG